VPCLALVLPPAAPKRERDKAVAREPVSKRLAYGLGFCHDLGLTAPGSVWPISGLFAGGAQCLAMW